MDIWSPGVHFLYYMHVPNMQKVQHGINFNEMAVNKVLNMLFYIFFGGGEEAGGFNVAGLRLFREKVPVKNGYKGCVDVWSVHLPLCLDDGVTPRQICWLPSCSDVLFIFMSPCVTPRWVIDIKELHGQHNLFAIPSFIISLLLLTAPTRAGMGKLRKTKEGIKARWLSHSQQIRHFIRFYRNHKRGWEQICYNPLLKIVPQQKSLFTPVSGTTAKTILALCVAGYFWTSKLSSENRLSGACARTHTHARTHARTRARTHMRAHEQTCRVSEINAQNELSAGDKNSFGFGWRGVRLHIYFCSSLKSVSRGFARSSARAKHGTLHGILYPIFVSVSVANSGRQRVFLHFLA